MFFTMTLTPARRTAAVLALLLLLLAGVATQPAAAQNRPAPPDQEADWSRWRAGQLHRPVTVRSVEELARALSTTHRDIAIPMGVRWELDRPLQIPANRGGTADRPRRIAALGKGNRPTLICNNTGFLEINGASYLEISGIAAIANRDGKADEGGIYIRGGGLTHILIEDMAIRGFKNNLAVVADKGTQITDLTINRCIFAEPWHIGGEHAQNIFFNRVDRWLILDTILYHAGWQVGKPEQRTRFNHNLYIDLDDGEPVTDGQMRGCYTGYASSHAFQIRATATVTDTIAERSAYLGTINMGGTVQRYVGMFADHIPAEENNWTGIGLEVGTLGGTAKIHDAVLAHRDSGGRKTAINCAADPDLRNIRILGPWTTNSDGPISAGGKRFALDAAPGLLYSENENDFLSPQAKVDDDLLQSWLTRDRGEWNDKQSPAAACAALRKAYGPR